MRLAAFLPLALLTPLLAPSGPAGAEEIALRPHQAPGDAYLLSLTVTTDTEALSRGGQGRSAGETVRLAYQAYVVVLEVDERGRARRERHEGAQLTFERPGDAGSLFEPNTELEVRRGANHSVRTYIGGRRAGREVEKLVAEALRSQLEHSLEAQLLDPGRAVELGERWELDPKLARRFLRERGVTVLRFAGPPTAWLEAAGDGAGRVLRYSIPVAWYQPERMPRGTQTSESEASLEGRVLLSGDAPARPVSRSSELVQRLHGVTTPTPGVADSSAWRLFSSTRSDQRVMEVQAAAARPRLTASAGSPEP
jgi:hypothetical protein